MPTPEDAATLTAHLQGVDEAARSAEAAWGVGRLPLLVDVEMRAKFNRQKLRFDDAYEHAWQSRMLTRDQLDAMASAASGMQRAWSALDAAARKTGNQPADPDVWEAVLEDGSIACVVQTNADASRVLRDGRSKNVWTLAEVARAIEHLPEAVRAAKETFPGATVTAVRARTNSPLNDPIPF